MHRRAPLAGGGGGEPGGGGAVLPAARAAVPGPCGAPEGPCGAGSPARVARVRLRGGGPSRGSGSLRRRPAAAALRDDGPRPNLRRVRRPARAGRGGRVLRRAGVPAVRPAQGDPRDAPDRRRGVARGGLPRGPAGGLAPGGRAGASGARGADAAHASPGPRLRAAPRAAGGPPRGGAGRVAVEVGDPLAAVASERPQGVRGARPPAAAGGAPRGVGEGVGALRRRRAGGGVCFGRAQRRGARPLPRAGLWAVAVPARASAAGRDDGGRPAGARRCRAGGGEVLPQSPVAARRVAGRGELSRRAPGARCGMDRGDARAEGPARCATCGSEDLDEGRARPLRDVARECLQLGRARWTLRPTPHPRGDGSPLGALVLPARVVIGCGARPQGDGR